MNVEEFRLYCLQKAEVTESFPFDEETLVFKVAGKIFAIVPLERAGQANLKCDPDYALELREQYAEDVLAGWHMSKKHWNTIRYEDTSLSDDFIRELIDHSYEMVVKKMKKADRERLMGD